MLAEGVPPAMIENVASMAGMPVGPLSLNDEVAIDLALKIVKATKAQVGEAAVNPAQEKLLVAMVEGEGRLGRKNKKGFYDYPGERAEAPLAGPQGPAGRRSSIPTRSTSRRLKQRLLVTQALEAARTVEEGVITDPREADVGSILGFGFAPYTGGALSYIDFMGAKALPRARASACEAKHGDALRRAEDHPRHGGERRHVLRTRRGAQGGVRPRASSRTRRSRDPGPFGERARIARSRVLASRAPG